MAGALTERVFVLKLRRIGFASVEVVERYPFDLSQAEEYPLFTDEVVDMMRRLIPAQRQERIAVSATFTAVNPE